MAHLLRGKQAGVQNDFSVDIEPDHFCIDDLRRYGISSRVTELAYDPVQSLLAVGTGYSSFGLGQIYIFGQKRISCTFALPSRQASVRILQFCSDKLLCLDDKNNLTLYGLESQEMITTWSAPGKVTALASDASLDYAMLGMSNGDLLAYDMDRENLSPFRIPCLLTEQNPKARHVPIVSLQFHPRDIGKLLIGYAECAVIFSFKQNDPKSFFQYHLPRGAPGGDSFPSAMNIDRNPKLTQAVWHPTGTFVLTGHEDSSLVVWDAREGRVVMARTLTETNIDQPGGVQPEAGKFIPKTPLLKLAWCAQPDPDETGILIAGGTSTAMPTKGMSFFELGRTPNYATSSWKVLSNHFEDPKRQSILPTPPNVEVVNFCLIPQKSPWFAGAQDPIAILALLSSGEITTMSFPSGFPISPTNQLHLSMTLVHPFVNAVGYSLVERKRWLGLTESRPSGPKILTGGAEAPRPLKRFEDRSIMQTAHADGTIRLWDAGHADEIENENVLQADVCNAVGRQDEVMITNVSFSGAGGELAAGLHSGEVVIFRWLKNRQPGQEPPPLGTKHPGEVTDISNRRDPGLVEGFHPFTLLNEQNGPVTALSVSDVGFIAAAFKGGGLAVIDMRGPAIIFKGSVNEFSHSQRGGNFHKKNASAAKQPGFATSLEFSVMTLDEDGYSSILLHAGTNAGAVSTLKILPGQGGRYSVAYTGTASLEGPVVSLCPLSASSGRPANATQQAVAGLRNGTQVDGVLLAVTRSEARIFRPPAAKGAHKSWDGIPCESAAVTRCLDLGMALVCLFGDGSARSFSLPGLREIGSINLSGLLDLKRLSDAAITGSGDIIAWTGPAEMALLNVWGTGDNQLKSKDKIFNAEHLLPPRPTISNFQWVSGTQFITPADMDILIGGPNRPPSKRQIQTDHATAAAARAESRAASRTNRPQNPYASGSRQGDDSAVEDEGYWAYMQRQVTERTEKLGFASESTEKARSNSSGFADDVNKFVSKQKRGLVTGLVKSKFGL